MSQMLTYVLLMKTGKGCPVGNIKNPILIVEALSLEQATEKARNILLKNWHYRTAEVEGVISCEYSADSLQFLPHQPSGGLPQVLKEMLGD